MQKASKGTRKWLSVRMAFVLVEIFMGAAALSAWSSGLNENHHRGVTHDL
jgi:hypothetical protein